MVKRFIKKRTAKRKTPKRTYKKKTSLVSLIKKISLKQQETKHVIRNLLSNVSMLHNSYPRLVSNLLLTEQGINDSGTVLTNRIGDSVTPIGVKLFVQLSQPADRPNVTFRLAVVKFHGAVLPPGTMPQIGVSGNVMLDPIDTEKCTVVKTWTIKANDNYWEGTAGASKQMGKFFTLYLPLSRKPYVYSADGSGLGKMYQLTFLAAAYDVYGTLITDNIGFISLQSQFYFKDA